MDMHTLEHALYNTRMGVPIPDSPDQMGGYGSTGTSRHAGFVMRQSSVTSDMSGGTIQSEK